MYSETLKNIVEDIVSEAKPEKIILFGSFARGEENENSDIDLLIIEKSPFSKKRSRRKEIQRIREKLSKYKISKDILIYDEKEFEFWKDSLNHIIGSSLRNGKILYER
ncbi:MAG: nucleotidyltransferase domain-containing protein [Ignavibacteriales bacterium]|nr:nucleotidyltransferase domain-containing protein [Ignavibacteriales bacterium]